MAVLAKIRQRSALLIGAIAIALFAFIIQDLIGKGGLGQNRSGKSYYYRAVREKR